MISNLIKNYNRKENKVKPYLAFKSSTPMTITPNYTNSGVTLQYSLDAKTWTNISANGVTPSSNVIYFRGSATGTKSLYTGTTTTNAWIFTGATNLEVNGDITMLIQDNLGGKVRDIVLGAFAFDNMFYSCTSLTTAPELPATTLADSCYQSMLRGCTKIMIATVKTGGYQTAYRVPTVGTGVDASNALLNMFSNTGGAFADTPTINTTYYTENTIV